MIEKNSKMYNPKNIHIIIPRYCEVKPKMETKNKIIIAILVIVIIILSGAIISTTLFKEETKTVELFENGTTIEVPLDTVLKSHDEFSTIYITDKNTTIISINNNNLAGALVSKILSTTIVEAGTKQDNGLYKLDKNSVMEIGDKLGLEYDENNCISCKEGYYLISLKDS